MKEVKFRGKRIDNDNWIYGLIVKTSFNWYILKKGSDGFYDDCKVELKTIGQYTGLKDKNEQEIYEGDILQLESPKRHYTGGYIAGKYELGDTVIVSFKEGNFIDEWTEKPLHERIYGIVHRKIEHEVVGNIYENPDLLGSD